MKKAAILLAAIFLWCTSSALAVDGELSCGVAYNVEDNRVLISVTENSGADNGDDGQIYFTSFNAMIKKSGETSPFIAYSDTTDENGNFSKWFAMPEAAESGTYTAAVKTYAGYAETSFWYMNKASAQTAINALNSGTSIENAVELYSNNLGIDADEFKSDANIAKYFKQYAETEKLTAASFYNIYNDALAKAILVSDADLTEKLAVLKAKEKILNINYAEIEKQSSEIQTACFEAIKKGYNSSETLSAEIENNLMMSIINAEKSHSWEKYADLLLNVYKDKLKLDTSDYGGLKYKSEAIKMVKNDVYNEIIDLKNAFYAAVSKQQTAEKSSDKNSGGGVGGAAGGGTVVNVQFEGIGQSSANTEKNEGFVDVPENHWAAEAVNYLAGKGIVNGRTASSFEPDSNITRAEFSKIIASAFFGGEKGGAVSFNDVAAGEWYYNAVSVLASKGIVMGTPDGYFNPNTNISREDMAVIIARTADITGKKFDAGVGEAEFSDAENISDYAADAVAALYKAGVITGMPGGAFAPKDNLTRAQACKVIWQIIK